MHMVELALNSAWRILLVSILLGAGIPAIFAFSVRSWAAGAGELTTNEAPKPIGRVLAIIGLVTVAAAIALGLAIIIGSGFGKVVSFEHIVPTLVDKKH